MPTDLTPPDLEALVQHSADVITVLDGEGHVLYETPSIERVLGYDPSDLVGRRALDYVHPDDREAAARVLGAPLGDDETPTAEFRFQHADGTWVWLEAVAADAAGTGGYVVDARDVTERRATDRERASILDRMTDGFCALDEDWTFTYLNERAEALLGRDAEDLIGREVWTAFPESRDSVADEKFHAAVDRGETVTFELEVEQLDAYFEVRAYPDENGLTVYFRDVTEQRQVRSELEGSVRALHSLYEIAADPELSFETKRARLLELGQSYFGLSYGFVTRIRDGIQRIEASTGTHELLQRGETCPLEESYCRKTIERDEILSVADATEEGWEDDRAFEVFGLGSYVGAKLVVDGELYGTLCFAASEPRATFSDSERTFVELAARWLAYELEERRYRERLEDRNDRLEEFASIVSHDLRNPLNVARGELEMAREGVDEDADDHLDAVAESHERMTALIDDLLTLAREGESVDEVEPVNLAAVAADCWETVATAAATLRTETEAVVRADRSRLQQLLENLIRNAVEHGGSGVTVTVGDLPDGGFYVADDGPGIPEDERDRVFESGYTTRTGGTGFGLRIVDQIAAAHGWSVTLAEADGGGARFEITGVEPAR